MPVLKDLRERAKQVKKEAEDTKRSEDEDRLMSWSFGQELVLDAIQVLDAVDRELKMKVTRLQKESSPTQTLDLTAPLSPCDDRRKTWRVNGK